MLYGRRYASHGSKDSCLPGTVNCGREPHFVKSICTIYDKLGPYEILAPIVAVFDASWTWIAQRFLRTVDRQGRPYAGKSSLPLCLHRRDTESYRPEPIPIRQKQSGRGWGYLKTQRAPGPLGTRTWELRRSFGSRNIFFHLCSRAAVGRLASDRICPTLDER